MAKADRTRRRRRKASRAAKVGLPPGAPVYVGEHRDAPIHVELIDYDSDRVDELATCTPGELAAYAAARSVTWVNVDGLHEPDKVVALAGTFNVHPLWVEDILNVHARPKAETMPGQVLVIVRALNVSDGPEGFVLDVEHNGFVLGAGWLLTFQEHPGDTWTPIRERIRQTRSRVRTAGADYLLHALLDGIVDQYFVAIERLERLVDEVEDEALLARPTDIPARFAMIKADVALVRSAVLPMRDAVAVLLRREASPLQAANEPFFRDLSDHILQVIELTDALRERLVVALELHLAVSNQQLNEVMRVLTLVSNLFIPLTFIAGIYGMNFSWMPETLVWWGYPLTLAMMGGVALGILGYYRRRGWL